MLPHLLRRSRGRHVSRRSEVRRVVAAITALLLVGGVLTIAQPALAASAALRVTKTVDEPTRAPGDEFTYTIEVGCDDGECADAQLTDQLPADFAGFAITSTSVTPTTSDFPSTSSYTGCTTTVTASCTLGVRFGQTLPGGGSGILAGATYQVHVTLAVPTSQSAAWSKNGAPVTNTATATSSTAPTASGSVDVTVTIPITVDTAVTKSWTPNTQQFSPGAASTISLTTRNTSNVPADSLALQEPATAVDGATTLDAANPFRLVDLVGTGSLVAPQGASLVQVDAYVVDGGAYHWVTGTPVPIGTGGLPGGVSPADVAGVRLTFTDAAGAVIAAGGSAGSIGLQVAQRSAARDTGAQLVGGSSVTNTASSTVHVPAHDAVTRTASAPYTIGGLSITVGAAKSITPSAIPAGTTASASISGTNTSNGPVDRLTLADQGYFTQQLRFGGFTSGIAWPAGTTAASVAFDFSDGSTGDPITFGSGQTPAAPTAPAGAWPTGFTLVFTGRISAGQGASAQFAIAPDVAIADSARGGSVSVPDTVSVTGSNAAGTATRTATAPLVVYVPAIGLMLDKTISPSASTPIAVGGTALVALATTTEATTQRLRPSRIVVQDAQTTAPDDFWNAFDADFVAPTQVPAGAVLTVETTTDGTTWTSLGAEVDATGGAKTYPRTDVPAGVRGIRFTFDAATAFAAGTSVKPYVAFVARGELRDGGEVADIDGPASRYTDTAVADASATVQGRVVDAPTATDTAPAAVQAFSGAAGTVAIDKAFTDTVLTSQSGQQDTSHLRWSIRSQGVTRAVLADPSADPDDPAATAFSAFDLVAIQPVSSASDPALQWDRVSAIERYSTASAGWVPVTAPGGGWMTGRTFRGYTLSATERSDTTGVRVTIVPDDAARSASTDPTAPAPGSGITTSAVGAWRTIDLLWQLRNVARPGAAGITSGAPTDFVTARRAYDGGTGRIANTAALLATTGDGDVGPVTDTDTVTLLDQPPVVSITKQASAGSLVVPERRDVDPSAYPTTTWSITAKNGSVSRPSYIRVADPMPCASGSDCVSAPDAWGANPWAGASFDGSTNPFQRFDLVRIDAAAPDAVDRSASTVTLWTRAADGTLGTRTLSLAAALTATASDLADVIGVAVVYQGTDPADQGGTIPSNTPLTLQLTGRLRVDLRTDTAQPVAPISQPNAAFAQGYDPVLAPTGSTSTPHDDAGASVQLQGGQLGIRATKTFSTHAVLERDRATPITATLAADQGAQTVATRSISLDDADGAFWSRYRLTSLGQVTLPAGTDRVRVDLLLDGAVDYTLGTPGVTASLGGADPSRVTGIRFVFTRADGDVLSHSATPPGWSTSAVLNVQLLDTVRDTSTPIPFPSTVTNSFTAYSERFDDPTLYASVSSTASDTLQLQTGTFALDVQKSPGPNHTVTPGDDLTWTLVFTNTGTGYLTVPTLVDTVPAQLEFDGVAPTFARSSGGTLSQSPTWTYDPDARTLAFAFPDGGRRMSPGESFTVTVGMPLQPVTAGTRVTNAFVVHTLETLDACTNASGNGQGVLGGQAATDCGTSNYVQPVAGASLVTSKSVRGEIDGDLASGAVNVQNPASPCLGDAEGFVKWPCAARSAIGGHDLWRLKAVNSGTVGYTSLTFVDALPVPGDRMLATSGSRGSTFRPVFDGAYGVQTPQGLPTGASLLWQVTTVALPCISGTTSRWNTDPTCQSTPTGITWTDHDAYAGDWSAVTGIRAIVTFASALAPAAGIELRYQTVDAPATTAHPDGASTDVQGGADAAWNQFGAVATLTSGPAIQRAPVKAGVVLARGPLAVTKAFSGAAAAYAPDAIDASASCTVAGAPVALHDAATLHLDAAGGWTARLDGVPVGASCTVDEAGSVGTWGESSRPTSTGTVRILTAGGSADAVPAAQTVALENRYDTASLVVRKHVDTLATAGDFGAFPITVACVSGLGATVPLAAGDASFSLADGQARTITGLPIGAACTVTETDARGASVRTVTGTGVVDSGNGAGVATIAATPVTATVTNRFDAGTLSVLKTLDGDGATAYGTGPFSASVLCTWNGQQLYSGELAVVPDLTTAVPGVYPAGTACAVAETTTGGATEHTAPATVTIPAPTDGDATGHVTAGIVNAFRTGSVRIVKERTGPGAAEFGAGPFTAHLVCTWQRDGETVTAALPDSGDVTLAASTDRASDYAAEVDGILIGADCVVTEPDAGLAVSTSFSPADGHVTVLDPDVHASPVTVTITNVFEVGSLSLQKTLLTANPTVGAPVQYRIRVTNTGAVPATGFQVVDRLPAGAKIADIGEGGVAGPDAVTWSIASLAAGAVVDVTVSLAYAADGTYVNHAELTGLVGPFVPTTVTTPCAAASDVDLACATLQLRTLAYTGSPAVTGAVLAALAALIAGAGLLSGAVGRRRRRGAHR